MDPLPRSSYFTENLVLLVDDNHRHPSLASILLAQVGKESINPALRGIMTVAVVENSQWVNYPGRTLVAAFIVELDKVNTKSEVKNQEDLYFMEAYKSYQQNYPHDLAQFLLILPITIS